MWILNKFTQGLLIDASEYGESVTLVTPRLSRVGILSYHSYCALSNYMFYKRNIRLHFAHKAAHHSVRACYIYQSHLPEYY